MAAPMIDDKLLAEIKKTLKDAQFGYCAITSQLYVKHVGALLEYYRLSCTGLLVDGISPALQVKEPE